MVGKGQIMKKPECHVMLWVRDFQADSWKLQGGVEGRSSGCFVSKPLFIRCIYLDF